MEEGSENQFSEEDLEDGLGFVDPDGEEELKERVLKRQNSFQVFTNDQIKAEQKKMTTETVEVLGLPSTGLGHLLLLHYKWNKEQVINEYMEDPSVVLHKAGLRTSDSQVNPKLHIPAQFECPVCLEVVKSTSAFGLPCGHIYCSTCWTTYLELKVKEGAGCLYSHCMHPKCKESVQEEVFAKFTSKQLYAIYQNFLIKSFAVDNPHVKPCPSPHCSLWIRCERKARKEAIVCLCGFRFCFNCGDYEIGDHLPATCKQVEDWLKKASDESENVNWMLTNTKKCPKCRSPIEKNGGCMHIVCSRNSGGCGFEFCWLCRGDWAEHGTHTGGYYNCNKYEASSAKKEDEKASNIKTELEYYMWHFHRYDSHRNAMKVANHHRIVAAHRGEGFQSVYRVRSTDVKFLVEAADQLSNNRRVFDVLLCIWVFLGPQERKRKKPLSLFTRRSGEVYQLFE
eukprot:TRINITY_DN1393_c0_g1_i1.p1 TRINITY_DN1393_c0_g1~~TRINITY_DN1393_c0_g1_i1.p1  ORF type:complete len:493 (-),score=77.59 TRINITY_DN1393_c0_g1_i1:345-1703(-)